jgi:hypothetical protein
VKMIVVIGTGRMRGAFATALECIFVLDFFHGFSITREPALRAARASFAPKTLESTSNFRPRKSSPTSRESIAPENRTPIQASTLVNAYA